MTKLWAALLIVASVLLIAPVIESGTPWGTTAVFQALGSACAGGS